MKTTLSVVALSGIGLSACASPDPDAIGEPQVSVQAEANHGVVASQLFGRNSMVHGIAGDADLVFVTEVLAGQVPVHDRLTGHEVGLLPPPPGGWLLPFQMRIVEPGHLVVLDAGGFPGLPTTPRVYDYAYEFDRETHTFSATLVRTVGLDGLPIVFTEDVEVLDDGTYVVSDVVLGALWLIGNDGSVVPGIVPESFAQLIPELASCVYTGPPLSVDGIPFSAGGFAPGVGSLATDGAYLYYGNGCLGGIHRLPLASLFDTSRSAHERAGDAEVVSAGPPGEFDVIKGIVVDRSNDRMYAVDSFHLRVLRVDPSTGERETLIEDSVLFDFPVTSALLPSPSGTRTLVVASDQEHRFPGINQAITSDLTRLPFVVTKVLVTPAH